MRIERPVVASLLVLVPGRGVIEGRVPFWKWGKPGLVWLVGGWQREGRRTLWGKLGRKGDLAAAGHPFSGCKWFLSGRKQE